ncbi:MAG: enoyl-CoA hydratase/isomerase family protein [Burkholderiales bacterium]
MTRTAGRAPAAASSGVLVVERRPGVLVLTLSRPAKLNALDHALIEGLLGALDAAQEDDDVRAIVVRGEGRAFCAGIDLEQVRSLASKAAIKSHAALVARLQSAFRDVDKPVICAVHGYAFGAGCGLVAASDIAIAARSARLGYPEVTRNVLPALVLPSLVRQVGRKAAFHLVASGAPVDAATAATLGLVTMVVEDADLEGTAMRIATELAQRDPHTLVALKRLFMEVTELPFAQALRRARVVNEDLRGENVRAGRRVRTVRDTA